MYTVTFIRADLKPDEVYYYQNESDARYHFSLFRNDGSGLYRTIQLKRDSQLVDAIHF